MSEYNYSPTLEVRLENWKKYKENLNIYYMAYEDWDYESHYPVGFFTNLKILKESIIKMYNITPYKQKLNLSYTHINVYKVKMNECFDFCDLEEVKEWWKEE